MRSHVHDRAAGVDTAGIGRFGLRALSAAAVERPARLIGPTARLVLVPGAGHVVTLTHATAVDAPLRGLLARTRPAPQERRTP
ncbi:hypothetical protein [Geodermatophilus sp. DSM 44513]|uniref:hypothetical protein n=1 Tax=Geodermatophilus sp. DSM 44513 TaxID=1528104 RepID=UPI001411F2BB|nr:hypothetical protein [Geodermatophilus sp. DSM 44513]WNV77656.1 hypothetical protein RTG05_10380 [Geodermatophilus sp. DSM 44513]